MRQCDRAQVHCDRVYHYHTTILRLLRVLYVYVSILFYWFPFLFYLNFSSNRFWLLFFWGCFWFATVQLSACPLRASAPLPNSNIEAAAAAILFLLSTVVRSSTCLQRLSTTSCCIFILRQCNQAPNQRNRAYHCDRAHL